MLIRTQSISLCFCSRIEHYRVFMKRDGKWHFECYDKNGMKNISDKCSMCYDYLNRAKKKYHSSNFALILFAEKQI